MYSCRDVYKRQSEATTTNSCSLKASRQVTTVPRGGGVIRMTRAKGPKCIWHKLSSIKKIGDITSIKLESKEFLANNSSTANKQGRDVYVAYLNTSLTGVHKYF